MTTRLTLVACAALTIAAGWGVQAFVDWLMPAQLVASPGVIPVVIPAVIPDLP